MSRICKHEAARRDLIEHFIYLAESAGLPTADRFLTCAEESFSNLLQQPQSGQMLQTKNPALVGIRRWRVKGFENWLIFYRPTSDGISVIRVLHAAQDWWSALSYET